MVTGNANGDATVGSDPRCSHAVVTRAQGEARARGTYSHSDGAGPARATFTKMPRTFYVYILASRSRRLYVGVTNDLLRRLAEHRRRVDPCCHTARYNITRLVYYETSENVYSAIAREKEIKGWGRERRLRLIESVNAGWLDLGADLFPGDAT
jgi:putative endonuclease